MASKGEDREQLPGEISTNADATADGRAAELELQATVNAALREYEQSTRDTAAAQSKAVDQARASRAKADADGG